MTKRRPPMDARPGSARRKATTLAPGCIGTRRSMRLPGQRSNPRWSALIEAEEGGPAATSDAVTSDTATADREASVDPLWRVRANPGRRRSHCGPTRCGCQTAPRRTWRRSGPARRCGGRARSPWRIRHRAAGPTRAARSRCRAWPDACRARPEFVRSVSLPSATMTWSATSRTYRRSGRGPGRSRIALSASCRQLIASSGVRRTPLALAARPRIGHAGDETGGSAAAARAAAPVPA